MRNDMTKRIVFISEAKNLVETSVADYLKKKSYQVISSHADIDAINEIKENLDAIVILTGDHLTSDQKTLCYIKDLAITSNVPLFAIGTPDELKTIKGMIPANLFLKEFLRPLSSHISTLADTIDRFIRQNTMRKKILVVDDSGPMLNTVKGWLGDKYSVFLVNSSAMAIKYLTLNRPDLILLDYKMPVADGKQLLEMLRAEAEFSDIPVIFLTVKGDAESFLSVMDLKPEGYLLKSIGPEGVIKAVDDFFRK